MAAERAGRAGGLGPLLAAVVALDGSASLVFALLADLRAEHGLATWHLGLISGSAFVANVTAQLRLADRGRARTLLRAGLLLAIAGNLLFAFGSTVAVFVAGRVLLGLGGGTFAPAARAVAAASDPDRMAQRLGQLAAATLVGFTIGPVAGTVLASAAGLRAPFLVAAAVAAASLPLLGGVRVPDTLTAPGRQRMLAVDLLRRRPVAVAAGLAVALFVPVGMYDAVWAQYLTDRGAATTFVGISMAAYGIPFALLASAGGRLADRVGPVRCALAGLAVVAPLTWSYGLLAEPWLIAGASIGEACVQAVAFPAAQAAMGRACPPGRLAAGQGLAGALQQVAAAAMAFTAAPLYGAAGSVATFGTAAALVALVALTAAALHRTWPTAAAA